MMSIALELPLKTFTCHPVGGPVCPSARSVSNTVFELVPHTGAPPTSSCDGPSALLNPPSATGNSELQNAVAVPIDLTLAVAVTLANTSELSVVAAGERQVTMTSCSCL